MLCTDSLLTERSDVDFFVVAGYTSLLTEKCPVSAV